jgi:hypothetical protein
MSDPNGLHYSFTDNPHLQLPMLFLLALALLFFAIGFVSTAISVLRLAKLGMFNAGATRSWSERMGARNRIGNQLFVSPEFARLRFWLAIGYGGYFLTFGAMLTTLFVFGKSSSH